MKIVHKGSGSENLAELLVMAKALEKEGELKKASTLYEKLVRRNPKNEFAYDRLMIIYRKERDYKQELATVKKAIRAYQQSNKSANRIASNRTIANLSRSILRSLDMVDNKGKALYEAQPVARWRKRQGVIEHRMSRM